VSVTGHRDIRLPDDFYATPEWCTRLLLPHLQRGDVLDPCCGEGAIGKVVFETWGPSYSIDGYEIDAGRAATTKDRGYFDTVVVEDFLGPASESLIKTPTPLVITNPPFSLALEFAEKSVQVADTVAFLLRLAWLSSAERSEFHQANPCDLIILPKRPSFVKFVSCEAPTNCGWHQAFKPDEPHPKKCPMCGRKVKVTSSDSADYGWFIWGPGRGGRIHHPTAAELDLAQNPVVDVAKARREFKGAAAELEELLR
jgi:hypothetical protein